MNRWKVFCNVDLTLKEDALKELDVQMNPQIEDIIEGELIKEEDGKKEEDSKGDKG